jgi:hypothetical protein
MKSRKEYLTSDDNEGEDEGVQVIYRWRYECWACVCRSKGWGPADPSSEAKSRSEIFEHSGNVDWKKQKVQKWQEKMTEVKDFWQALGVIKGMGELRSITRSMMTELFAEVADFVTLKSRSLSLLNSELQEHREMLSMLRKATDPREIADLASKLEEISTKSDLISYPDMDPDLRQLMVNAASYTDEFCRSPSGASFRFFYLCRGGGDAWPCLRLMPSKTWRRLFPEEAWKPGQRWFCSCQTRYKAKFGCIVEIVDPRAGVFYMKAPCPTEDMNDIQAARFEKKFPQARTPADLYAAVPACHPATTCIVKKLPDEQDVWQLCSKAVYEELPAWEWEDVFHFVLSR